MRISGQKKTTITLLALPHARMGARDGDHVGGSALLLLCLIQATFNALTASCLLLFLAGLNDPAPHPVQAGDSSGWNSFQVMRWELGQRMGRVAKAANVVRETCHI